MIEKASFLTHQVACFSVLEDERAAELGCDPIAEGEAPRAKFWSKSCLRTWYTRASEEAPRLASSVGLAWTPSWQLLAVV